MGCRRLCCAHANKSVAIIHLGVFIIMSAAVWALGENVFGTAAGAGARPLACAANVYSKISRQPLPHHRKSRQHHRARSLSFLIMLCVEMLRASLRSKNTNQNQYVYAFPCGPPTKTIKREKARDASLFRPIKAAINTLCGR
jgi:hypothetical protein